MDQDEYIKALKPIAHPDLTGAPAENELTPALTKLFWSLLGALAYSLLTQHWLAVYVVSLQRATYAPRIIPPAQCLSQSRSEASGETVVQVNGVCWPCCRTQ